MEAEKTQVETTVVVHEAAYVLTLTREEADFLYRLIGGTNGAEALKAVQTSDRVNRLTSSKCTAILQDFYRTLNRVL